MNTTKNRKHAGRTAFLAMLLLSAALVAMAPSAQAHTCHSSDEKCDSPCPDDGRVHDHQWVDEDGEPQYCHSEPDCEDVDNTVDGAIQHSIDLEGTVPGEIAINGDLDRAFECDSASGIAVPGRLA